MIYIVRYHYSLAVQRYKSCVCMVWDTTDITFRREHREKALHHSFLSLNIKSELRPSLGILERNLKNKLTEISMFKNKSDKNCFLNSYFLKDRDL